ncbi:uncharacterized protein TRIVIDRAFT_199739 [Trichoderma virens Gv29-8]|uniref:Uncharacterized protein n=1 Tax=Hypocrea virens (strain Gv29-8 / FGSC 10586) TaxID=413071 RepID=G9MNA3_HYPVG|nr:uncharacterized protein TRIVIDRAFT_199739 [Trichoderma virens Gv29-8]EHK23359.1 hypothetical protein TRIVIDRAFT_199739 [Trichoderma virens Gv29-8]UKZ49661.1 hypothetical protein TrVGV298_003908 [Trichoderma virens]UKZ76177.1 hypothetical protein TrVFT333_003873 [Trichoderma virens FT-333]
MQFKLLSVLATALTVQSAYAMSSTQQGQAQQQSEQSQQVHQLEQLAHEIHVHQMTELHQLDIGLPALNASAITATLNSVSNVFATTGTAISNITAVTLAQQLPNIISSISALAGNLVTNVASIITTPVTSTFSDGDQLSIYNAFATLTTANTQLINAFVGPNGLVSNSLLRGPIGVVLNLIERTVVNLAGAIIARIPAYAQQAQTQLSQIHSSLALTISV